MTQGTYDSILENATDIENIYRYIPPLPPKKKNDVENKYLLEIMEHLGST